MRKKGTVNRTPSTKSVKGTKPANGALERTPSVSETRPRQRNDSFRSNSSAQKPAKATDKSAAKVEKSDSASKPDGNDPFLNRHDAGDFSWDVCDDAVIGSVQRRPKQDHFFATRYSDTYIPSKNVSRKPDKTLVRSKSGTIEVKNRGCDVIRNVPGLLNEMQESKPHKEPEQKTNDSPKKDGDKGKKHKESEGNSYLKRVKSKIYKNKSDVKDVKSDTLEKNKAKRDKKVAKNTKVPKIMEDDENEEVVLRKSNSSSFLRQYSNLERRPRTFGFGSNGKLVDLNESDSGTFKIPYPGNFLRQYSNLERVRPRTFGLKSSVSQMGIPDMADHHPNHAILEKPKLTKSKSSSAINLNLLRTRRSKMLEQSKKTCKNADTEFDFIAYGSVVNRRFGPQTVEESTPAKRTERPTSWIFGSTGDRQSGQPVSRSSSDKRPDAVTEENSRPSDDHEPETDAARDNLHNVPRARSSQPAINRSESYKEQSQKRRQIRERRKISDPNLSKSNDVDSDHQPELSYHSGSSSNSSLSSSRSSESPQSTSLDTVAGAQTAHAATGYESDLDIEPDPPDWQSMVPEEVLSRLHPEEKKRQEVINELFHTEKSHFRNLLVLETVFYRPLLNSKYLPPEQVNLLFPNLEEMLDIHGAFNASMKAKRKEETVISDIGELLLNMFDGPAGENFQRAAATFCARQQLALESLKERRKKDQRLHAFLLECESDKLCKRLQLKDIIPTGMQRLVKYPLLFESLKKYTERLLESTMTESLPSSSPTSAPSVPHMGPTPMELPRLRRALERSKDILNTVNQAVKEAEDYSRLQEIQKKLDKASFDKADHHITVEYKNMDLTRHKLIYEGPLQWRINKQKLSMHVVLLEEILVLLQKQDDRFVLKFYTSQGVERSPIHSPIVKVSTVLVRPNAAAKDSLFLVNTSHNGAQIYDLVAPTPNDCKTWFKHISDAADAYKSREGKSRRCELSTPESEAAEMPAPADGDKPGEQLLASAAPSVELATATATTAAPPEPDSGAASATSSQRNSGVLDDDQDNAAGKRLSQAEPDTTPTPDGSGTVVGNSKREAHMRLATEDQPLIQPSEVTVNVLPVHTAQPVITPIEQVRRKDEAIRQALAEKQALVAEILHVPPEEFHTIADMAGDMSGDKEPTELVLAAVSQASQLWSAISDSLNVTEADQVVSASPPAGAAPPCGAPEPPRQAAGLLPNSHRIQDIASTLNTQLTALLKVVKEREDERERMRRELQKLREQLHVMHEAQLRAGGAHAGPDGPDAAADHDAPPSELENIAEDT